MDFSDFAKNLEDDILFGTMPHVTLKLASIVIASGGFKRIEDYKEDLTRFTAESVTSVASRNISRYVLTNVSKKPVSFGKKVAIQFASRAIGTLTSQVIFSKNKNIKSMLLYPLYDGTISAITYMLLNHNESSRYLRAYFPEIHNAIMTAGKATGLDVPVKFMFDFID